MMARLTGLEPATPGVTGRYSNQLSYNRIAARFPERAVGITHPRRRRQATVGVFFTPIQHDLSAVRCRDELIRIAGRQTKAAMRPIAGAPCLFCGLDAFLA
jgi:hypothetical protein